MIRLKARRILILLQNSKGRRIGVQLSARVRAFAAARAAPRRSAMCGSRPPGWSPPDPRPIPLLYARSGARMHGPLPILVAGVISMLERKQLKGRTRVTFILPEDTPDGPVSVVGDFNHWNPAAHPWSPAETAPAPRPSPCPPTAHTPSATSRPATTGSTTNTRTATTAPTAASTPDHQPAARCAPAG